MSMQRIQSKFVNHCACLIQNTFRTYRQQKMYQCFLPMYRKLKSLFLAIWKGYVVRKIFKFKHIKKYIQIIKAQEKNGNNQKSRIIKRQCCLQIYRLQIYENWVNFSKKQPKNKLNCLLNHQQKIEKQRHQTKKYNFKQILKKGSIKEIFFDKKQQNKTKKQITTYLNKQKMFEQQNVNHQIPKTLSTLSIFYERPIKPMKMQCQNKKESQSIIKILKNKNKNKNLIVSKQQKIQKNVSQKPLQKDDSQQSLNTSLIQNSKIRQRLSITLSKENNLNECNVNKLTNSIKNSKVCSIVSDQLFEKKISNSIKCHQLISIYQSKYKLKYENIINKLQKINFKYCFNKNSRFQ